MMTNFHEESTIPSVERMREDFGQFMFGSGWAGFMQDREQSGTLPP
jgi:hypothetical protein